MLNDVLLKIDISGSNFKKSLTYSNLYLKFKNFFNFDILKYHTMKNRSTLFIGTVLLSVIFLFGCNQTGQKNQEKEIASEVPEQYVAVAPEWSKNVNIYEVNVRQYTKEGTFKSFESHLPRLRNMGVDILWFMPIHPVGEKNRKGTLGSYYSVKDYKAVNPEFGTLDDFKSLVNTAHDMGFKVILDWVANHTAWDNQWIYDHPEWYTKDSLGNMIAPYDWSDVADLNFEDLSMREAMIDALRFWVSEVDIDGYRCDVAGEVPIEFWEQARKELDKIKPVFMLAEAEVVEHHNNSFDMSYAWELHHIFNDVAKGHKNANDIQSYFERNDTRFPAKAYRMAFITNHDENSWNGTIEERMGDAGHVLAVLSYTLPGMPLIYSGQEVGLAKRLEFFEKDQIEWDLNSPLFGFYANLNSMKKENEALWNGEYGGNMTRITTNVDDKVFAFIRNKGENSVMVIANLSGEKVKVEFSGQELAGDYTDVFTGKDFPLHESNNLDFGAWNYKILKK